VTPRRTPGRAAALGEQRTSECRETTSFSLHAVTLADCIYRYNRSDINVFQRGSLGRRRVGLSKQYSYQLHPLNVTTPFPKHHLRQRRRQTHTDGFRPVCGCDRHIAFVNEICHAFCLKPSPSRSITAVQWLRRLVAGLFLWRPGFDTRSVCLLLVDIGQRDRLFAEDVVGLTA
jgi:hypothetical protein